MVVHGVEAMPDPQAGGFGNIDASRLEVKSLLAKGGFALCYRATYQGEDIAVKVIPRHTGDSHAEYCFQAWVHECLLLQGLRHENIVQFMGVVTLEPHAFSNVKSTASAELLQYGAFGLVQELCKGGSLADVLHGLETDPFKRAYKEELALEWCLDICSALEYLHTLPNPIIHRDLKLDNILLAHNGQRQVAKLVDFGLSACIANGKATVASHRTDAAGCEAAQYMKSLEHSLSAVLAGARTEVGHGLSDSTHGGSNSNLMVLLSLRQSLAGRSSDAESTGRGLGQPPSPASRTPLSASAHKAAKLQSMHASCSSNIDDHEHGLEAPDAYTDDVVAGVMAMAQEAAANCEREPVEGVPWSQAPGHVLMYDRGAHCDVPTDHLTTIAESVTQCSLGRDSVVAGNTYVYSPTSSHMPTYTSTGSADVTHAPGVASDTYDAHRSLALHTHSSANGTTVVTAAGPARLDSTGGTVRYPDASNDFVMTASTAGNTAPTARALQQATDSAPQGVAEGVCAHPLHLMENEMIVPSKAKESHKTTPSMSGASSPGLVLPCPPVNTLMPLNAPERLTQRSSEDMRRAHASGAAAFRSNDQDTCPDEASIQKVPVPPMALYTAIASAAEVQNQGQSTPADSNIEMNLRQGDVYRPRGGADTWTHSDCGSACSVCNVNPSPTTERLAISPSETVASGNSNHAQSGWRSVHLQAQQSLFKSESVPSNGPNPVSNTPFSLTPFSITPLTPNTPKGGCMDTSELPLAPGIGYWQENSGGNMSWCSGANVAPSGAYSGVTPCSGVTPSGAYSARSSGGALGDLATSAVEFEMLSSSVAGEGSGTIATPGADETADAEGTEGVGTRVGGLLEVVQEHSGELGDSQVTVTNEAEKNANVLMSTADLCAMFDSVRGGINRSHAAIVAAHGPGEDSVPARPFTGAHNADDSSQNPFDRTGEKELHRPTPWMLERNASDKWRKSTRHVFNVKKEFCQRSTSLPTSLSPEPSMALDYTEDLMAELAFLDPAAAYTHRPLAQALPGAKRISSRTSLRSHSLPNHSSALAEQQSEQEGLDEGRQYGGSQAAAILNAQPKLSVHEASDVPQDSCKSAREQVQRRVESATDPHDPLKTHVESCVSTSAAGQVLQTNELKPVFPTGTLAKQNAVSTNNTGPTSYSTAESSVESRQSLAAETSAACGAVSESNSPSARILDSQLSFHIPQAAHASVDTLPNQLPSPPEHAYAAAYSYVLTNPPGKAAGVSTLGGSHKGSLLWQKLSASFRRVQFRSSRSQTASTSSTAAPLAPIQSSETMSVTSKDPLSLPSVQVSGIVAQPTRNRAPAVDVDAAAQVFSSMGIDSLHTEATMVNQRSPEDAEEVGQGQDEAFGEQQSAQKSKSNEELSPADPGKDVVSAAPAEATESVETVAQKGEFSQHIGPRNSPGAADAGGSQAAAAGNQSSNSDSKLGSETFVHAPQGQSSEEASPVKIHEMYGALKAKQALQRAKETVLAQGQGTSSASGATASHTANTSMSTKPSAQTVDSRKLSSAASSNRRDALLPPAWSAASFDALTSEADLKRERIHLPSPEPIKRQNSFVTGLMRSARRRRADLSSRLKRSGTSIASNPDRTGTPPPRPNVYGASVSTAGRNYRWKMTEQAGSLTCMAPEVLRGKPYNAKVDMFSFSVVVYQIFGKQNISSRFHSEDEVLDFAKSVARGRRLAMPTRFSKQLCDLIDVMWADDPRVRPTAADALKTLKCMKERVENGEGTIAGDSGRSLGCLPSGCLCVSSPATAS